MNSFTIVVISLLLSIIMILFTNGIFSYFENKRKSEIEESKTIKYIYIGKQLTNILVSVS